MKISKILWSALLATTLSQAADIVVEAESGTLSANLKIAKGGTGNVVGDFTANTDLLTLTADVPAAGNYTIVVGGLGKFGPSKVAALEVNGTVGSFAFPGTVSATVTVDIDAGVYKLNKGINTFKISPNWTYFAIDYLKIVAYEEAPFTVTGTLATPKPSDNALKLYSFLYENFQKKVVSGVMTNEVLNNNDPRAFNDLVEVNWIKRFSGKQPALLGLDFLHGTGLSSETNSWHQAYTASTIALAKEIWGKGGIPAYNWHWKDPSQTVENFYTNKVTFDLTKAFTDNTYSTWDESSAQYQAIIYDIDKVAGYLKELDDAGVPVLWRPLHEAAGKWFWWGAKGAEPCKQLWKLLFDRLVNHHQLDNLIWVWTSDEASDATDWYPGDEYVDIVGRDYYYYPREANHASLSSSFRALKKITNGTKIVTLSECGSVPHPDSMANDGANWSWFMPWNGSYVMDSVAADDGKFYNDNSKAFWDSLMTHDFVLSLDEMPGWGKYVAAASPVLTSTSGWTLALSGNQLQVGVPGRTMADVSLYDHKGNRVRQLYYGQLGAGVRSFDLAGVAKGNYLVRVRQGGLQASRSIELR